MTFTASASAAPATTSITITGATSATSHTTSYALTVTAAPAPGTLFTDGFENGGWTTSPVLGTEGAWTLGPWSTFPQLITPHSGGLMGDFEAEDTEAGEQARLASNRQPLLAIPSTYSKVTMTFWIFHETWVPSIADSVQVQLSIKGGYSGTSAGAPATRGASPAGWTMMTVDLSAFAGQTVNLGFLGTSQDGADVLIDDVTVIGTGTAPLTYTLTGTISRGRRAASPA